MANPWLKKNPLMSMWMSGANRIAGTLRGQAVAEANRQVKAAITEAYSPTAPAQKTKAKAKAKPPLKRKR